MAGLELNPCTINTGTLVPKPLSQGALAAWAAGWLPANEPASKPHVVAATTSAILNRCTHLTYFCVVVTSRHWSSLYASVNTNVAVTDPLTVALA